MKAWKEQLYKEREELMDKYEKISHFIATCSKDHPHYLLLISQQVIMLQYLQILDERIKL